MPRRLRRGALAAPLVLLALLAPSAASAAVTPTLADGVLAVTGDGADDAIDVHGAGATIVAAGTSFARADVSRVSVAGGGGADTITIGDGLAGLRVDVRGGTGADTVTGGPGDETFFWSPGDGSDTIEGGAGDDALVFTGANVNEQVALAANGDRARLTRDVANVVMDLHGIERLTVNLLGGTDAFTAGAGVAAVLPTVAVDAGQGDDTVAGGDEADTIDGGAGLDTLTGGGGDDTFTYNLGEAADTTVADGGAGSDTLWVTGTPQRDAFTVGTAAPGTPQVTESTAQTGYAAVAEHVAIDALGGDDDVTNVTASVPLDLRGGDGDDVLTGAGEADRLDGGPGADVLTGLGGGDTLIGGPGPDALRGGDGADRFSCGGVGDTLDATAQDTVDADCFPAPVPPPVTVPGPTVTVTVPGPAAPAADTRAPALTLRGLPSTVKRAALLKSGLSVRVAADERAALAGELLTTARSARIAVANLTLAAKALPLAAAGTRTLTLKPSRKLIGSAKRFTLTVRVTATDAAGNRRTATKTVKVR